jgi:hypothetical protein
MLSRLGTSSGATDRIGARKKPCRYPDEQNFIPCYA